MANARRSHSRVDADGVRIEKLSGVRSGVWLIAAGLVIAGLLLVVARSSESPSAPPATRPAPVAMAKPAPPPVRPAVPAAEPRRLPVAPAAPPAEAPAAPPDDAADAPEHQDPVFSQPTSGEPSGIALFPPPGTDPVKRGLVVPEGFELPPGYLRHYQTTDDGESLPAILMFHPDYHPVDAQGEPIALPADRVVPPDMAPLRMPVQMLELPEDAGAPPAP